MKKHLGLALLLLVFAAGAARAATPQDNIHYQGVLRDASGNPLGGDHDMVFRYYDSDAGGTEIMFEEHLASGTGAVTATAGLIGVVLGSGNMVDGPGSLAYTSVMQVLGDYADVWIQIEIDGEVLSPRLRIMATPLALNARELGGAGFDHIAWDETDTRFEVSDDLTIDGRLMVRTSLATAQTNHNRIGSATSHSTPGSDDLFVSGSVEVDDVLYLNKVLYMNDTGSDSDQFIYFLDGGNPVGEWLRWNDAGDRFELSNDLRAPDMSTSALEIHRTGVGMEWKDENGIIPYAQLYAGTSAVSLLDQVRGRWIFASDADGIGIGTTNPDPGYAVTLPSLIVNNGPTALDGSLFMDPDGPDGPQSIHFYNGGGFEQLAWDDNQDRFELTDNVAMEGPLLVGSTVNSAVFNWLGNSGPAQSGLMGSVNDLFVSDDLETGGDLAIGGNLLVNPGGPDADRSVYFHDDGTAFGESLSWDNAADRFELSNDLQLQGSRLDGPAGTNFIIHSEGSLQSEARSNARTMFDQDDSTTGNLAEWFHDGSYANTSKLAQLDESGNLNIAGAYGNAGFDLAEMFLASESLEPGDIVRIDRARPGAVLRASGSSHRGVIGVVSSAPGVVLGGTTFHAGALREAWGQDIYDRFVADRDRITTDLMSRHPELAFEADALRRVGIENEDLSTLAADLEERRSGLDNRLERLALEEFTRTTLVPVALAGRVPVKVEANGAAIEPGDPLAPGPTPGVAVKAVGDGPVIGTALEGLAAGTGKILTFVHLETSVPAEPFAQVKAELDAAIDERTPDPVTGVQTVTDNLQVVLDRDGTVPSRFSIFRDGEQRGALGAEVFRVDEAGNVFIKGALRPAAMDVAEYFAVSEAVEPGDVLVVDTRTSGKVRRARAAADPAVIGVVAVEPGVLLGGEFSRIASVDVELAGELDIARQLHDRAREASIWDRLEARFRQGHAAVALSGTVEVKVDAGYGEIRPGDLLVASPTPGHAMRGEDPEPGTVLGKALGALDTGQGRIRMLVMLR